MRAAAESQIDTPAAHAGRSSSARAPVTSAAQKVPPPPPRLLTRIIAAVSMIVISTAPFTPRAGLRPRAPGIMATRRDGIDIEASFLTARTGHCVQFIVKQFEGWI